MLHVFTKRTVPSRFRQRSALRFKRISLVNSSDFRENAVETLRTARSVRQALLAQQSSNVAYLSSF